MSATSVYKNQKARIEHSPDHPTHQNLNIITDMSRSISTLNNISHMHRLSQEDAAPTLRLIYTPPEGVKAAMSKR
jgi:hypothetical protein